MVDIEAERQPSFPNYVHVPYELWQEYVVLIQQNKLLDEPDSHMELIDKLLEAGLNKYFDFKREEGCFALKDEILEEGSIHTRELIYEDEVLRVATQEDFREGIIPGIMRFQFRPHGKGRPEWF